MQEPESSWKEYCSKKERDSAEFLGDMPRTAQVLTMAVVATEPVGKLSARLQHLDAHSDSLREVLDDKRGPIRACQRHLWTLANSPARTPQAARTTAVGMLLDFFHEDKAEVFDELVKITIGLSAKIWARFEVLLCSYPFPFVPLGVCWHCS